MSSRNALFVVSKQGVVLGDWSPFQARSLTPTLFDPDEIEYVVGVAGGVIQAVYQVEPDAQGNRYYKVVTETKSSRYRIQFNGVPVMAHLNGTASPVTWSQGQGTPVKAVDASVLFSNEVVPEAVPTAEGLVQRAVFGDVIVTCRKGSIVVDAPPGTTVTVRTTAGPASGDLGARPRRAES